MDPRLFAEWAQIDEHLRRAIDTRERQFPLSPALIRQLIQRRLGTDAMAGAAARGVGCVRQKAVNRLLTTALWFFCALTVEACSNHGRVGALPTISDPTQAAEIIVMRDQRFLSAAGTITVVLDGVLVYGIDAGEHVILRVPAGEHVVAAIESLAIERSIMLDAQPGRRYYLRLQPIVASGAVPILVAAPQGEELLAKTARVN